jgi:hypothetical protein
MDPFSAISKALTGGSVPAAKNDGHTTSGLDAAMQAQADKLHPTGGGAQQGNSAKVATSSLKRRVDGSMILPMDGDYKP